MRADLYLFNNSYVESRQKAQRLIKEGHVLIDGIEIKKSSEDIDENIPHSVNITNEEKYVGRGALKLEGALDAFGIDPSGAICADIGASTGGFTDCLLQRNALKVYAFDSGRGQLHPKIASNERVVSREGFNARYMKLEDVGEKVDIVVMDVSFISQTFIIPAISNIIKDGGTFVSLIKPQFEAGRSALGKNGIVKDAKDRYAAVMRVLDCANEFGFSCRGFVVSSIKGGDGNEEYLAHFVKTENKTDKTDMSFTVKEVIRGKRGEKNSD